jgi:hypothetical protein
MLRLHPKEKGLEPKCYCGDVCKMDVSEDYKTTDCNNGFEKGMLGLQQF